MLHAKNTWNAEKRLYERQFYAVLRRRTKIIDIAPEEGEIGYTSELGNIHLAYAHPIMHGLSPDHAMMFRYGVFTHETLHQVFTSFSYLLSVLDKHKDTVEKKVISTFANLVEDPAIEFFAPQVFGGEMLDALRFSVQHVYKETPSLEESKSPFTQLINALIMFGDMGLLKGKFTFPEAEKYFRQIAPEFNDTVENPNPKERIDMAERWMILTRPMWQKEAAQQEEFEKLLQQLIEELMDGGMQGSGDGSVAESDGSSKEDRSKRRNAFAKALEESEKSNNEESESLNQKGASTDDDTTAPAATDTTDTTAAGTESDTLYGVSNAAASAGSDAAAKSTSNQTGRNDVLNQFQDRTPDAPVKISEDIIHNIKEQIAEELKRVGNEKEDTLNLPVAIPKANGKDNTRPVYCENIRVSATGEYRISYPATVSKLSHEIKLLSNSLKQLLREDYDEALRSTSGRYILKRDITHTSVKVFDKKREKKEIEDMAVMLLIDCSGSMAGRKSVLARETAIVLAESFAAVKIPCYILGFTADAGGQDVLHFHYVSWKNTKEERSSLMHVDAYANNDDGYSIRYATELLKKKRSEHKLLFVLSDGAPACGRYRYTNGIYDTALAIREAKKVTDIFGIGIGISNSVELKNMYKGNYINVFDTKELTRQLTKQLRRVIRTWM